MMSRRKFIEATVKTSAGMALAPSPCLMAEGTATIQLTLSKAAPATLPANFIGLGYEMSSVAAPGLLSTANHRYVELIKGLGPEGVLRVGGIVANYTRYVPDGPAAAEPKNTVIARASLERFGEFLRKTGWTAIWSVNFAQGSVKDAIGEARAVREILGPRLLTLELGNEVDSYSHGQPFRAGSYGYESYRKEYTAWHDALLKALPGLPFAAPDTAGAYDWVERMAGDAHGDVQLLATHYYRNYQKRGSAEQLLHPDPRLKDTLARLRIASQRSGIPWRMCETNSFSGGGRPGVSDTFVGALWTLDYMLLLAAYGCSGVNVESGVNQLGFVSSYSPVQDDGRGVNSAGVPYYGMLAFANAAADCHEVLPTEFENHGVNLTAYALGAKGTVHSVVLVNRDSSRDAQVAIAALRMGEVTALRLLAPAAYGKTGVTFAGSAVNTEGRWSAKSVEPVRDGKVTVPRMSAAVLRSVSR